MPLPLVSFGGSAVMTVMLCLGLLMALERQQRTDLAARLSSVEPRAVAHHLSAMLPAPPLRGASSRRSIRLTAVDA